METVIKAIISLVLVISQCLLIIPVTTQRAKAASPGPIKILGIGNSFTQNAFTYLYDIAESYGYTDITIAYLYIAGGSLENHWNNASGNMNSYSYRKNSTGTFAVQASKSILHALQDESWDYISLQQSSGNSGDESTYEPYLTNLIKYVKDNSKNKSAKLIWHMTWAYQSTSDHKDFPRYNNNQTTMYNAIINTTKSAIDNKHSGVFSLNIPSGTAIQNVRTGILGDALTADGYHLNKVGNYIAGLMWFKSITKHNLTVVSNKIDINSGVQSIAIEAVNNAYASPYKVTAATTTAKKTTTTAKATTTTKATTTQNTPSDLPKTTLAPNNKTTKKSNSSTSTASTSERVTTTTLKVGNTGEPQTTVVNESDMPVYETDVTSTLDSSNISKNQEQNQPTKSIAETGKDFSGSSTLNPLIVVLLVVLGAAALGIGGWFVYRAINSKS